jgi:malonyl-CoA O-methyltransferase
MGAHNATAGRNRGLTGRGRLAAVEAAYEVQRREGRLPATWEVVYGHAWAGAQGPPVRAGEEFAVPLSQVGRRR